jgi:hypothetical protein
MAGVWIALALEFGGAVCACTKVATAIKPTAATSFRRYPLVICVHRALCRTRTLLWQIVAGQAIPPEAVEMFNV